MSLRFLHACQWPNYGDSSVTFIPTKPQPPTTAYTHFSTRAGVLVLSPQAPEERQLNDVHLTVNVSKSTRSWQRVQFCLLFVT